VKADLKDELDKVNADAEKLRALNVSHDEPNRRSALLIGEPRMRSKGP
jgi:hypothetical protein